MAAACPAPAPDDPLVRGLLSVVDCNVQELVRGGYAALFQPTSSFAALLTALLTIFVAVFGYRLLLGRSQLSVSDLALTAVKLGVVLALATQWDTYQAVVYNFLFQGPAQLAGAMLAGVQPDDSAFRGDVFDGLQRALDSLAVFSEAYSKQAPAQASPLLGGAGFGAMALTISSTILLLSSLGVLLAAKIVLGMLLAVGPVFITLLLFESTRGVFEGWLRAALAFAFVPLATTLLLGVALTMLEPALLQIAELQQQRLYPLGPVYGVLTLVLVFAGVSAGMIIAGGMIAGGLKLPRRADAPRVVEAGGRAGDTSSSTVLSQSRAGRVAAATAALERREASIFAGAAGAAGGSAFADRRTAVAMLTDRAPKERVVQQTAETRLGQGARRSSGPRSVRAGARRAR